MSRLTPDRSKVEIRPAVPHDVTEIHALTCELAAYEKLRHTVVSTPSDFHSALFGDPPLIESLVAEIPAAANSNSPNRLAGSALFYSTFSSFTGKPGLWLEDLYVTPEQRGHGLGKALLLALAQLAVERDCGRLEWNVLDWNESAQKLYASVGAELKREWLLNRVSGETLHRMAALVAS